MAPAQRSRHVYDTRNLPVAAEKTSQDSVSSDCIGGRLGVASIAGDDGRNRRSGRSVDHGRRLASALRDLGTCRMDGCDKITGLASDPISVRIDYRGVGIAGHLACAERDQVRHAHVSEWRSRIEKI